MQLVARGPGTSPGATERHILLGPPTQPSMSYTEQAANTYAPGSLSTILPFPSCKHTHTLLPCCTLLLMLLSLLPRHCCIHPLPPSPPRALLLTHRCLIELVCHGVEVARMLPHHHSTARHRSLCQVVAAAAFKQAAADKGYLGHTGGGMGSRHTRQASMQGEKETSGIAAAMPGAVSRLTLRLACSSSLTLHAVVAWRIELSTSTVHKKSCEHFAASICCCGPSSFSR